jgi:hypothetical protein
MGFTKTRLSAANPAVANRFVTSVAMKVGAYTVANGGAMPTPGARRVTITHTTVAAGTDTLGTVTVTGTDQRGQAISEIITPLADAVATGVKFFASVATVVGAGWVIAGGNDTLVVGCEAGDVVFDGPGELGAIAVNTTAAGAISLADANGTFAVLKASIAEGMYRFDVDIAGFLRVTLAAASDITVIHSVRLPSSYAS